MTERTAARTTAWQCTGCGKLESDATCIGVCQDRKVVVVSAADYDAARRELDELRLFIRQLALVSPRDERSDNRSDKRSHNNWERTYKALQERARKLLAGGETLDEARSAHPRPITGRRQ